MGPQLGNKEDTLESKIVSTKQLRIAKLAKQSRTMSFLSLNHYIDLDWLRTAYHKTRKDGAVGVDGQTAKDYEANLEENLRSLLERAKSGSYYAPPVRRVHIPKDKPGETRPLGIPTFEDKVLQRAVVMILEPLYEQDFKDCSYGFRPGRSAHGALQALWGEAMGMKGGWIVDLDIRKFFDTLDPTHLRRILGKRVRDGVIQRLIGKWLKAGIREGGQTVHPEQGTPQGGVISPILSNIYLHEVLDTWFAEDIQPRLKGRGFCVRYADDAVLGFSSQEDARKVMDVLPKRFIKYGLTLHPEKTRLIPFHAPRTDLAPKGQDEEDAGGEKFNFLGFTHFWGKSRKGTWVVKRKTMKERLSRTLRRIGEWCRRNLHLPAAEQRQALSRKLQGHYAYYGITGNARSLNAMRYRTMRIWRQWLNRRGRGKPMPWDRFNRMLRKYPLPPVRIVHSYYNVA
jgi:RNA-directed DNA polymerase